MSFSYVLGSGMPEEHALSARAGAAAAAEHCEAELAVGAGRVRERHRPARLPVPVYESQGHYYHRHALRRETWMGGWVSGCGRRALRAALCMLRKCCLLPPSRQVGETGQPHCRPPTHLDGGATGQPSPEPLHAPPRAKRQRRGCGQAHLHTWRASEGLSSGQAQRRGSVEAGEAEGGGRGRRCAHSLSVHAAALPKCRPRQQRTPQYEDRLSSAPRPCRPAPRSMPDSTAFTPSPASASAMYGSTRDVAAATSASRVKT